MKVYILCYRGTIYGVFSSREKAYAFAEIAFSGPLAEVDWAILEREVQ